MGIYDIDYIAEQWIYETLISYEPLVQIVGENSYNTPQVYRGVAPQDVGATYPLVIYQNQTQGGTNIIAMNSGGTIVGNESYYVVKVVGTMAQGDLVARANRAVRDALHAKTYGLALDGQVLVCTQERTYVFPPENIEGEIYESRGGLYRLLVQEVEEE